MRDATANEDKCGELWHTCRGCVFSTSCGGSCFAAMGASRPQMNYHFYQLYRCAAAVTARIRTLIAPSRLLPSDRVARSALPGASTRAVVRGCGFGATVFDLGVIAAVAAASNGLSSGHHPRSRSHEVRGACDD